MIEILARPLWHGAAGPWDEIIYGVGFVISVFFFVLLAFADRFTNANRRQRNESLKEKEEHDDDMDE